MVVLDVEPEPQKHHGKTDDDTWDANLKPCHLEVGRNFIAAAGDTANDHEYESDEHHEDAGSLESFNFFPIEHWHEEEESENSQGD